MRKTKQLWLQNAENIRAEILTDSVKSQQKMGHQTAWSPSTGEAATCKGTRGCHRFAEVMAFRVVLEHTQEHQWP